jgi:hypothetical protein
MSKGAWNVEIEERVAATDYESFVGLRLRAGKPVLRLPLGYAVAPAESGQRCLGDFSRILARFASEYPEERRSQHLGDGYLRAPAGQSYRPGAQQPIGYSKIGNCLQLIRRLRDPKMMALMRMPGLAGFDPRYISRNLERATYLPDGTPLFDTMWSHAPQLRRMCSDMVGLAAWTALDTIEHIFPSFRYSELDNALAKEWELLAERFADDYDLDSEASLYTGTSSATLAALQSALQAIARQSPPLHADARELYDILDRLLNFSLVENGGEIWGLEGFHRVWEAACLEHAQSKYGSEAIFTCDDELLKKAPPQDRKRWKQNRCRVFAHNGIARRPDLVIQQADGRFLIVDFKYSAAYMDEAIVKRRPLAPEMPRASDTEGTSDSRRVLRAFAEQFKLHQDIANLEAYRWLLMQHELRSPDESLVDMELWVPSATAAIQSCRWQVPNGSGALPGSEFSRIAIVYQSTRDIVGPYGDKFRIFD